MAVKRRLARGPPTEGRVQNLSVMCKDWVL